MTRDWATLPPTALVSILSQLPLSDRLKHCALVSTSWAAAAVVATQEVCLSGCADTGSVTAHLSGSYSSVRSLQIDSGPEQLLAELPSKLPKLQALQLLQTRVQLGPGFDQPGLLQAVTDLTHLLLQDVTLVAGLDVVSVLTALKHLSVTDCRQQPAGCLSLAPSRSGAAAADSGAATASTDSASQTEAVPVPGSLFSALLRLECLELRGGLTDQSLQHISLLTRLDSLALDFEGSAASPAALRGLDRLQGLSLLALTDAGDVRLDSDTVGGLSRLTRLEALLCYNCRSIDPVLLGPLTNLQHLDLDSTATAGGARALPRCWLMCCPSCSTSPTWTSVTRCWSAAQCPLQPFQP